jgi:hypothetical protein
VLDGIDARLHGPKDPFSAVRVRRHAPAEAMRIDDEGPHLFHRVLRRFGIVALGEHSAGCAKLDDVGAVFHDLPKAMLHPLDTVGDAVGCTVVLEGEQGVVAVTARDSE